MKSKLLSEMAGRRERAVVFDAGDEVMDGLKRFAASERLTAAHITGIGAFSRVRVAWFDLKERVYRPIEIDEQVEVISLIGDVAEDESKPSVHVHLCVGKRDGTAHRGHLQQGWVQPTLELTVVESPAHLRKTFRPHLGLSLIDLGRST